MKRYISTHEKGIDEFIGMLEENRYLIPSFQRDFIWEKNDILKLWDSIYNFYPVGSILCWDTDIKLNIHRRPGGNYLESNDASSVKPEKKIYILDGQQRATSILVAVSGGNGIIRDRKDIDYALYFDAANGIFFFADEYKKRKREIDPDFLVSLKDIHHTGSAAFKSAIKKSLKNPGVENNIKQLQNVFKNYKLPLVYVKGFDIPDVSRIFERINQEGKDLKSLDIMIARTFRNYQYPVEEDL
ncbi:MAG: DUF262 domain-containing protein [Desulfobacteraceae bacterium]|jgi:uncharacterized protein with ParB-like and HNH nuclease domain